MHHMFVSLFFKQIECILPYLSRYGSKIQTHEERLKECSEILGKCYYKSPFECKKMEPSCKKKVKVRYFSLNMFHFNLQVEN